MKDLHVQKLQKQFVHKRITNFINISFGNEMDIKLNQQ